MPQHMRNRFANGVWTTVFLLVLLASLTVRLRLLGLPLERDEGEYAYAGNLLLHGIPPYKLAYNMKFPGTYAAYAVIIAVFGHNATAIHLGYLLVNIATIVVIVSMGRWLFGTAAGWAAGAAYTTLSVNPSVLGLSAHATHFVILPALLGALILTRHRLTRITLFLSGLFFGLSLMMKQPGAFFALFGFIYLIYRQHKLGWRWRERVYQLFIYAAGVVLPFLFTCASLYLAGTFDQFWFWTVRYAADYGSVVSFSLGGYVFIHNLWRALDHLWLLWLIALVGLLGVIFFRLFRPQLLFLSSLTFCSATALSAGLYFRPHYFVLVLPIIALLDGAAVVVATKMFGSAPAWQSIVAVVFLSACLLPFVLEREFFFSIAPAAVSRRLYGANPFPEAERVAEFIRARTTPQDQIAIIGSEPEIYFYAQRLSATGYIYMYPAMEPQPLALQMQRQIISEIERAAPKVVVVVGIDMSWKWPVEGTVLQDWAERYVGQNYRAVGLVNIISRDTTDYYLPVAGDSAPVGNNYLLVCERR